ncbi:hypothetical protein MHK_002048 [Candidatus Magnetomorum sp. HK-1]|nr:hypothetical protein MHK_002048 [Candidatus Magnetomorum sp. HK-1]
MLFPYGISDFKELITQNYFYCDRTNLIPLIENIDDLVRYCQIAPKPKISKEIKK